MRIAFLFILVALDLGSCQSINPADDSKYRKDLVADSMKHARQQAFFDQALEMRLALIDQGVDSFEMRLWVASVLTEKELLITKYETNAWIAQHISYYIDQDNRTQYRIKEQTNHSISLATLADSLQQMRIGKMLSQDEIPGFRDNVADGVVYTLEMATKNSYTFLTYHCPEHFAKNELNNKRFLDLILLVDRYFHFWWPICSRGEILNAGVHSEQTRE